MEIGMTEKRDLYYEAPVVAVYEIEIERGFAASTETYELNEEQDW